MDIFYLQEFVDLAQTCNFQESAENMSISASSLSKHIHKMEEELGVPLFDRSTRSVTLNQYGEILQTYAEQIITHFDNCQRDIKEAVNFKQSKLNIIYLPMLSHYGILEIFSDFRRLHPEISLDITEGFSPEEMLLERKYDFVFTDAFGPKNVKINKIVLKTDHMAVVFPADHPLADRDSVCIEDLRGEKFLLQVNSQSKLTRTSQTFVSLCQKIGFEPEVAFSSRYISTIAQMVQEGHGVAVLNLLEILNERNFEYSIVDLEPEIPFDICVSYLPGGMRSSSAALFLKYLKTIAEENERLSQ